MSKAREILESVGDHFDQKFFDSLGQVELIFFLQSLAECLANMSEEAYNDLDKALVALAPDHDLRLVSPKKLRQLAVTRGANFEGLDLEAISNLSKYDIGDGGWYQK